MPSKRRDLRLLGLIAALGLSLFGCKQGGNTHVVNDRADLNGILAREHRAQNAFLADTDVNDITRAAAEAIDATTMVIAVTNREGQVLGVYRKANAPATVTGNFGTAVNADDFAVSLARTASFFSNDQAPLSSRTVRFISGIHFPPGIRNKPNAALYGIESTNRGCSLNTVFNPGKAVVTSRALAGVCHSF